MAVLLADSSDVPICLKGTNPDEDWIVFTQEDADFLEAMLAPLNLDNEELEETDDPTTDN